MIPFRFEPEPSADQPGIHLPAQLETKAALFDFLSAALPLPGYFGRNWDAFEECLHDLIQPGQPKVVLIHRDLPLSKAPADLRLYLQILAGAARASNHFSVLFPLALKPEIVRLLDGKIEP